MLTKIAAQWMVITVENLEVDINGIEVCNVSNKKDLRYKIGIVRH